jgi:hypothetical protein
MSSLIDSSQRASSDDKDHDLVLVTIQGAFDLICKYLKSRKARRCTSVLLSLPPPYEASTIQDSDIAVFTFLRTINSRLRIHILPSNLIHDADDDPYEYYLFPNPDISSEPAYDLKTLEARLQEFIKVNGFAIVR